MALADALVKNETFFLYVLPIGIREGVNKNKELKDSEISAQENNYLVAKYVVF